MQRLLLGKLFGEYKRAAVDKVTRDRDSFDPDRTIESILAGSIARFPYSLALLSLSLSPSFFIVSRQASSISSTDRKTLRLSSKAHLTSARTLRMWVLLLPHHSSFFFFSSFFCCPPSILFVQPRQPAYSFGSLDGNNSKPQLCSRRILDQPTISYKYRPLFSSSVPSNVRLSSTHSLCY